MDITTTKVKSSRAIVVTHPGATHYKVGDAMLKSGLLIDNGYGVYNPAPDSVVLVPQEGVDEVDVLRRLMREIDPLIATGEVVVA